MKFIPLIQSDFIAANGERITSFALIKPSSGCAHAVCRFDGETMGHCSATKELQPRAKAILRLGRIYQRRSTPVRFR